MIILLLFLTFIITIKCETAISIIKVCQSQQLLIGSDENMAKVVDLIPGNTVALECNFCGVADDMQAKSWFFKKRSQSGVPVEVAISMENKLIDQKFSMDLHHILSISNFTINDSGIYVCKGLNDNGQNIFTYFLDGTFNENILPRTGKLSEWSEYESSKLYPINEKFDRSNDIPYLPLRENFNFTFKIITIWEDWGKCEICGRQKGVRRKEGKCRLHPYFVNHTSTEIKILGNWTDEITRYYLLNNYDVPCRSLHLNSTFPELSKAVRIIPDFVAIEACEGICNPVIEGELTGMKSGYKYKMSRQIAENSHIALICPEINLDSTVEWFKNKQILNSTFRNNLANSENEPHVSIDAFNTLYILQATKKEEAVYSCTVNGKKIQKFDIRIVSKSKFLNQDFIRHSIYLAFVLSLTLTCYCTGMCVAWHRKSYFADPINPINVQ